MDIFVSAGEASSDIHCAHLIGRLKAIAAENGLGPVTTWGLGGDRLAAEGTELLLHNREFSVMGGPLEVLSKIPLRGRLERMIEKRLFSGRVPQGALLVDNGEINLRLASLFHFFNVPIVYFIPPKVWVWRHSRIEEIEQHVDLVLSILPFEEPIYKHWEIPFKYVGNPLIDELDTSLPPKEAKRKIGLGDEIRDVVSVFVGSRHSEVQHHAKLFGQALVLFARMLPPDAPRPLFVLPAAPTIDAAQMELAFSAEVGGEVEFKVVKGMSHECLRASRAALVKSGTSTLEAAVFGTPMVLAYHSSRSSEWIYRHVVRYRGFVGLVNLFLAASPESALGWDEPEDPIVPELILSRCKPDLIASELLKIYQEGPARNRMLEALKQTSSKLRAPEGSDRSPTAAAARAAFELFHAARGFHV